ncbi:YggT family protein [Neobacillus terrae]|uniref:YggT family protein n=1 Tax=Neobacillus terrae TaxID=3034837 RepID=UPI00140E6108|nr:YggT family protein [Neobacillus terrae]NHM29717.1 YggT family protein [Neobacillus terrae]
MAFVFYLLQKVLYYYSWILIIYILMSWFPNAQNSSVGRFLSRICEPYLEPFRRFVPAIGMIDISPIVAFMVLNLASSGLNRLAIWFV